MIRCFGSRKKIFNAQFRNIKGNFPGLQETFPDNGDVDMVRALGTYKEADYDGTVMPDHTPRIDGNPDGKQAFAFELGYIQALFWAVREEGMARPDRRDSHGPRFGVTGVTRNRDEGHGSSPLAELTIRERGGES